MFGLGMGELLFIFVIVLLLFGGKKLPQLGSAMGKAITNFKKGLNEEDKKQDSITKNDNDSNDSNDKENG